MSIKIILYLVVFLTLQKMSSASSAPVATFEEVKKLKNDKTVLLIDVRQPSELQEFGEIPGSINIPLGDLENVLKNLPAEDFARQYGRKKPDFNFPLIFTCRSGRRSEEASQIALELGYKNVKNYKGSWLEWEKKIKGESEKKL